MSSRYHSYYRKSHSGYSKKRMYGSAYHKGITSKYQRYGRTVRLDPGYGVIPRSLPTRQSQMAQVEELRKAGLIPDPTPIEPQIYQITVGRPDVNSTIGDTILGGCNIPVEDWLYVSLDVIIHNYQGEDPNYKGFTWVGFSSSADTINTVTGLNNAKAVVHLMNQTATQYLPYDHYQIVYNCRTGMLKYRLQTYTYSGYPTQYVNWVYNAGGSAVNREDIDNLNNLHSHSTSGAWVLDSCRVVLNTFLTRYLQFGRGRLRYDTGNYNFDEQFTNQGAYTIRDYWQGNTSGDYGCTRIALTYKASVQENRNMEPFSRPESPNILQK